MKKDLEEIKEEIEENKKEIKKIKQNENNFAFFLFVGGILIIFGLIFMAIFYEKYSEPEETLGKFTYNGFQVLNISNEWYTQIQLEGSNNLHTVMMRLGPMQVDKIELESGVIEKIENAEMIYLTVAPNLTSKTVIGMIEVGKITGDKYQILEIPTKSALTSYNEGEELEGTPIVTCENATDTTRVIEFKLGDTTDIHTEGKCIIVQGTTEDEIIEASDRLAYTLMGVIQ